MATEIPLGADNLADWVGKDNVMNGHYIEVCEFGVMHAQCRCSGPKTERSVRCDRVAAHEVLADHRARAAKVEQMKHARYAAADREASFGA